MITTSVSIASPRGGIKYEDVAAVAETMVAENLKPSIRTIRLRLGTGHTSTISKYLGSWNDLREKQIANAPPLHPSIQKVILNEIEMRIGEARASLADELSDAKTSIELLTTEGLEKTQEIENYGRQVDELNSIVQQNIGVNEQLRNDLILAKQAIAFEQKNAENARQALALADLELKSLPRLDGEIDQLRIDLNKTKNTQIEASQSAAVSAATLRGAEDALADTREREREMAKRLANAEQRIQILTENAEDLAERCHITIVENTKLAAQLRLREEMNLQVGNPCGINFINDDVKQ